MKEKLLKKFAERLIGRGTDEPEKIEQRVAKAEYEMTFAENFDIIIVNDKLEEALAEVETIVNKFLFGEE